MRERLITVADNTGRRYGRRPGVRLPRSWTDEAECERVSAACAGVGPNLLTTAEPLASSAALRNMTHLPAAADRVDQRRDPQAARGRQDAHRADTQKARTPGWPTMRRSPAPLSCGGRTPGISALTPPASRAACCPTSAESAPTGRNAKRKQQRDIPPSAETDREGAPAARRESRSAHRHNVDGFAVTDRTKPAQRRLSVLADDAGQHP